MSAVTHLQILFMRAMRGLLGSLTIRGRWFLAAGGAAVVGGLATGEPDLVLVGALLLVLPVSALSARGSRSRLSCSRRLNSPRVPAGQPVVVTARVDNFSQLRTEVLVAEEVIPAALGRGPRFALDPVDPGGHRELTYQIPSPARGKFTVGPLRIRVTDAFGLVKISRSLAAESTLVVTPAIAPLPRAMSAGSWPSEGGTRTMAPTGQDDAAPRAYQDRDGLRRVHWRSTARYGKLMVRREERQQRGPSDSASLLLDTRRCAHAGSGSASSFEVAVSAAASIGVHMADLGVRARLCTETGEAALPETSFESVLDMLAVISPSPEVSLRRGTSALARGRGPLIAVAGRLAAADAGELAAARRGTAPAMALLLAVSGWASDAIDRDTARSAEILSAAGWRVAVMTASTQLAAAWQDLHEPSEPVGRPLVPGRPRGERERG
jgi:uncharacterized protein (DUF58 family)